MAQPRLQIHNDSKLLQRTIAEVHVPCQSYDIEIVAVTTACVCYMHVHIHTMFRMGCVLRQCVWSSAILMDSVANNGNALYWCVWPCVCP